MGWASLRFHLCLLVIPQPPSVPVVMRALFVVLCTSALAFTACTPNSPTPPPAPTALASQASPSQSTRSDTPRTISPASSSGERTLDQRLADVQTEARVTRALVRDPALTLYDFSVRVESGRLTLKGDVNTRRQHEAIDRVLRRVSGIEDVENRVTVAGRAVGEKKKTAGVQAAVGIEASASEEQSAQGAYYTVESGDTLWHIAQRHQASIQRIKSLNRLDGSSLQPGQRIRVR